MTDRKKLKEMPGIGDLIDRVVNDLAALAKKKEEAWKARALALNGGVIGIAAGYNYYLGGTVSDNFEHMTSWIPVGSTDYFRVDTVKLPINHGDVVKPLWYETIIFDKLAGNEEVYIERYAKPEEAKARHERLCKLLKRQRFKREDGVLIFNEPKPKPKEPMVLRDGQIEGLINNL